MPGYDQQSAQQDARAQTSEASGDERAQETPGNSARQDMMEAAQEAGDEDSWYWRYVMPRAVQGVRERGIALAEPPDPDSPEVLLRLLRRCWDEPDVRALLELCTDAPPAQSETASAEEGPAPSPFDDPDGPLYGKSWDLYTQMRQLLIDEFDFAPEIEELHYLDFADGWDPQHEAILAALDSSGDGRVGPDDIETICQEDEQLHGLAVAIVRQGHAHGRGEARVGADGGALEEAAAYAQSVVQSDNFFLSTRSNWLDNYEGDRERLLRTAPDVDDERFEVLIAAVFQRHEPHLTGMLGLAQEAARQSPGDEVEALHLAFEQYVRDEASAAPQEGVVQTEEDADARRVTLVVEKGAEPTDRNRWYYHDTIHVDRAVMGTRWISRGIGHALGLGYELELELGEMDFEATHEVREALERYGTQIDRITLRGVEITPSEYEELYLHYAGGGTTSYARDFETGDVYHSASTEGRRRRNEQVESLEMSGRTLDEANPLVRIPRTGRMVLDSVLGRMDPRTIRGALELLREGGPQGMREIRESWTDDRPVPSDDPRFRGKTLGQAADLLYSEIDRLLDLCQNEIETGGAHVEEIRGTLLELSYQEVTRRNFDRLRIRVDNARAALSSSLGESLAPLGLSQEQVAQRAAAQLGEIRSMNDLCTPVGMIIDTMVPDPGDKGKFRFNFNLPLVQGGALRLGGEFIAQIERKDDGVKLRLQAGMKLSGNLDLKIAEVFGEANLFGYLEAYGDLGAEAVRLALLPLQQQAHEASEDLEAALFDPDWLPNVMDRMDSDDYAEGGTGVSVAAGGSWGADGENKASAGAAYSEGTRWMRRGDDLRTRDMAQTQFTFNVETRGLGIEVKVTSKEVGFRKEDWIVEGGLKREASIDELTDAESLSLYVSSLIGAVRTAFDEHSGMLGDDAHRQIGSALGQVGAAGGDRVATQVASEWHAARAKLARAQGRAPRAGAAKVGHKFGVKFEWNRDDDCSLDVTVERLTSVEFGDSPRDAVYFLLEDIDPVMNFPVL